MKQSAFEYASQFIFAQTIEEEYFRTTLIAHLCITRAPGDLDPIL